MKLGSPALLLETQKKGPQENCHKSLTIWRLTVKIGQGLCECVVRRSANPESLGGAHNNCKGWSLQLAAGSAQKEKPKLKSGFQSRLWAPESTASAQEYSFVLATCSIAWFSVRMCGCLVIFIQSNGVMQQELHHPE